MQCDYCDCELDNDEYFIGEDSHRIERTACNICAYYRDWFYLESSLGYVVLQQSDTERRI